MTDDDECSDEDVNSQFNNCDLDCELMNKEISVMFRAYLNGWSNCAWTALLLMASFVRTMTLYMSEGVVRNVSLSSNRATRGLLFWVPDAMKFDESIRS